VTAVRGNVDRGDLARRLPVSAVVTVEGVSIYVLHILDDLDLDPRTAGFHVVVSGHTHDPMVRMHRGVLYVNPGSAGPRRFRLPVTVAHLTVGEGEPRAEIITLPVAGS
jgi:putative phosphoesterase